MNLSLGAKLRATERARPGRDALILGIETSCDETAAALVTRDGVIRSNIVSSQAELHARYGGVVPEVASRRHLELVTPVIREALAEADADLDEVELVGVTAGPGLIGALLDRTSRLRRPSPGRGACLSFRSTISRVTSPRSTCNRTRWSRRSCACSRAAATRCSSTFVVAALGLVFSGRRSTTRQARRSTRARGCSGSAIPAAPRSTASPATAIRRAFEFPVARVPGLDFSFSGLKTALLYTVRELQPAELEQRRPDLAASYQRAIVRALVERTRQAAAEVGATTIAVVGGVAANSELRAALPEAAVAPLELCTDNAAMIASAARFEEPIPYPGYLGLDAYASSA